MSNKRQKTSPVNSLTINHLIAFLLCLLFPLGLAAIVLHSGVPLTTPYVVLFGASGLLPFFLFSALLNRNAEGSAKSNADGWTGTIKLGQSVENKEPKD